MRREEYEDERLKGLVKVIKLSAAVLFIGIVLLAYILRTVMTPYIIATLLLLVICGISFSVLGLGLIKEVIQKEQKINSLSRELAEEKGKKRTPEIGRE